MNLHRYLDFSLTIELADPCTAAHVALPWRL